MEIKTSTNCHKLLTYNLMVELVQVHITQNFIEVLCLSETIQRIQMGTHEFLKR